MRFFPIIKKGFTIVEVLVVIVLISVLAALLVPKFLEQSDQAKWDMIRPKMTALEQDISLFKLHCNRYPTQLDELRTAPATLKDKWKGPYGKESDLVDPWGNKFVYVYPGQKNTNSFDLISYGMDGKIGGEGVNADVVNQ